MYLKRIKELREDNDLTQISVAEILKTSNQQYSLYETGKREMPLNFLIELANFYNVSLDYLCEHKTNELTDYGNLNQYQRTAINILLRLPEAKFYEFLGRLKTTADLLNISY